MRTRAQQSPKIIIRHQSSGNSLREVDDYELDSNLGRLSIPVQVCSGAHVLKLSQGEEQLTAKLALTHHPSTPERPKKGEQSSKRPC